MEKFMHTLKANKHIQNIHIGGNKGIGGYLKSKMQKELQKNQYINGLMQNKLLVQSPTSGKHTINLKN